MPVLFGLITILPALIASREDSTEHKVAVVDRSMIFLGNLNDSKSTKFTFVPVSEFKTTRESLKDSGYYALLEIPTNIAITNKALIYSHNQVNIDVKNHIENELKNVIEGQKRAELVESIGVPDLEKQLQSTITHISVNSIIISETAENDGDSSKSAKKGSTETAMIIGYIFGFAIYMFIFMYGNMVMRGVAEEKQNRIVEVIISSVKPIQLMMGKILGIAAVGLTQIAIWVILIGCLIVGAGSLSNGSKNDVPQVAIQAQSIMDKSSNMPTVNDEISLQTITADSETGEIYEIIKGLDFFKLITSFIIFFVLGYLLYSSMMAAVAAAVDSDEDMNQFILPITIPLIAALIIMVNVVRSPESQLAVWASHIPFTSPIIMMVRIPFGVAWWEIIVSAAILALSTYAAIWMASKIYRTGILMYGKKTTWKELYKWVKKRSV